MNVNLCILAGRLTRNPELKYTPSGKAVCEFSIAVNRYGKDDEADFFDCVAWEKKAEAISQHFTKGKPIFIEGSARMERWETKEGQKRSKIKFNVFQFQFVGPKLEAQPGEPDEHSNDIDIDF